ncbi:ribonuclease HII [Azospirillum thiophilum]|uniref:Ribonuclease HII n=1 Tax=Azospirillum thiophilum TaxID=528244 RepID=A0AAC8W385_9PROT|nr:ribonuclease HII [Azospirillum thiophilum]ALG74247.1 ribonuclease HII [Azospirillum thiophilum]KJR63885.1 ribonuclease HII [Azospirillum thiophilum]
MPRKAAILRARPDLSLEAGFGPGRRVCGIDEVGRGPLCGPVVAAAVLLPPGGLPPDIAARIDDSKAVNRRLREEIEPAIRAHALSFAIAEASAAEIDELNIHKATLLAMKRAFDALPGIAPDAALIDGRFTPELGCEAVAIVKGDSRSQSIAAASILAKVARDSEMLRLSALYPHYGWDRNAGYPTPEHLDALTRHGVTPHHRVSFAPVKRQKALAG